MIHTPVQLQDTSKNNTPISKTVYFLAHYNSGSHFKLKIIQNYSMNLYKHVLLDLLITCQLMCAYIHLTQVHIHQCTCYMIKEHTHILNLQIHAQKYVKMHQTFNLWPVSLNAKCVL
jgi:hypothetical protein